MPIEPLPELKNERARMLEEGVDLPTSLGAVLAMDAMALGVRQVTVIAKLRPWMLVVADRDWITSDDIALEQAFSEMFLWPGTSRYFRTESRILAVAASVFVWREAALQVLSGQAPPAPVREVLGGHVFAVGFNCE